MTRRQVLQRIGVVLGGAVSAGVVVAVLSNERWRGGRAGWKPRTLTGELDELVATIAELIIPETDTPGARAARVDEFIDLLLSEWLDDADRDRFLAGLAELDATARSRFGAPFVELAAQRQVALLRPLDEAAAELRRAAAEAGEEVEEMPFFGLMKEMTLVGYYTSEVGLTEELGYEAYTGSFEGCVPLPVIA